MSTDRLHPVPRRRRGLTLVELLIVVAILGIVGVIVGIQIGSRDDLKVASAARVLTADLHYIQNRAIARRQPHFVRVGPGGDFLEMLYRDGGVLVALDHPLEPGPMAMRFGGGGSGGGKDVTLAGHNYLGSALFGFDSSGSPILADASGGAVVEAADTVTFTLAAGANQIQVRIEPITGYIGLTSP